MRGTRANTPREIEGDRTQHQHGLAGKIGLAESQLGSGHSAIIDVPTPLGDRATSLPFALGEPGRDKTGALIKAKRRRIVRGHQ